MRIGIITYWQTTSNYGQMLQNFALQKLLLDIGHEPYLIRYAHSEVKLSDWLDILKMSIFTIIENVRRRRFVKPSRRVSLTIIEPKDDSRKFIDFKNKELKQSDKVYYSLYELQTTPPEADAYIAGSDQIWGKTLKFKENSAFFLNFGKVNTKRIAYACSFGNTVYTGIWLKLLSNNLKRLDAISVREATGCQQCLKAGYNAEIVLDPTMLHDGDFYRNYFKIPVERIPRVFIYSLNISDSEDIGWSDLRDSIANTWKVCVTPASGYLPSRELFGSDVDYVYATIEQWLELIACSKLVVTTSFHGIVFCLLFHTPFIFVPLNGKRSKANRRVLDLLDTLGIKGRVYEAGISYSNIIKKELEWDNIDSAIRELRYNSFEFLKTNLS